MLLRHSLELTKEADALDAAAVRAMEGGARTPDIAGTGTKRTTREVGDAVVAELLSP